jgi:hypothetical protein
MAQTIDFSLHSFVKPSLHAFKFPHLSVCGVFLGVCQDNKIKVVDAIPLFHDQPLAPMLEVAFLMVISIYIIEFRSYSLRLMHIVNF